MKKQEETKEQKKRRTFMQRVKGDSFETIINKLRKHHWIEIEANHGECLVRFGNAGGSVFSGKAKTLRGAASEALKNWVAQSAEGS